MMSNVKKVFQLLKYGHQVKLNVGLGLAFLVFGLFAKVVGITSIGIDFLFPLMPDALWPGLCENDIFRESETLADGVRSGFAGGCFCIVGAGAVLCTDGIQVILSRLAYFERGYSRWRHFHAYGKYYVLCRHAGLCAYVLYGGML